MRDNQLISEELVASQIYYIRGLKVMIDRDLAKLYGVATKVLKQAVKRNIGRFPEDFMFEMTNEEFSNWRSQFVTSNSDLMGLRYAPYCFTEQGVAMLSSILNSEKAINVNIQIIRVFSKLRQIYLDSTELRLDIEKIRNKLDNQDKNMEIIFAYLDELSRKVEYANKVDESRKRIGYKP